MTMRGFSSFRTYIDKSGNDASQDAVATDGTAWRRWGGVAAWGNWIQIHALPRPEPDTASNPSRELAAAILRKLDAGEITDEQAREYSYEVGDDGVEASLWCELRRRRAVTALAKLRGKAKP